jgi:hypothetical protein
MVLVGDAPLLVDFFEADGEAKFEGLGLMIAVDVDASALGGREGDVMSGCDFDVFEGEGGGLGGVGEEEAPSLHVGVEAAGGEGRGDVKHENVRIVGGADGGEIFGADGERPMIDECADFGFVGLVGSAHGRFVKSIVRRWRGVVCQIRGSGGDGRSFRRLVALAPATGSRRYGRLGRV